MNAIHFDLWSRSLAATPSRRRLLAVIASGAGTLPFLPRSGAAGPGCKNVGKKCKKKKDCCSGVCKGKKGKKTCKAHGAGGCIAGQHAGACGGDYVPCTTSVGTDGYCQTTTGNAGYCSGSGLACMTCRADADCRALAGPDAACIRCGAQGCETACVGPEEWE